MLHPVAGWLRSGSALRHCAALPCCAEGADPATSCICRYVVYSLLTVMASCQRATVSHACQRHDRKLSSLQLPGRNCCRARPQHRSLTC